MMPKANITCLTVKSGKSSYLGIKAVKVYTRRIVMCLIFYTILFFYKNACNTFPFGVYNPMKRSSREKHPS